MLQSVYTLHFVQF